MKVSFIATVYNEEASVGALLKSLLIQSKIPDEIILVDGGSTDATGSVISRLRQDFGGQANLKFKIIVKKGNRSVGRNEAIKHTTGDIIACSDAGCILNKNWVKNITKPFEKIGTDVVAGYYKGDAKNIFQKCLVPYVLVMPDKLDKNNFLPVTRSMAFRKSIWEKAGKFPEEFSNNEDYVFAKKLREINARIIFEKNAVVYWKPRINIKDAFIMFYRFAKGDSESRIFRPKVILIFVRYIAALILLSLFFLLKSYLILNTLYLILLSYLFWSIIKNFKYVKLSAAIYYLPLIQISSDLAIMFGTIRGFLSFENTNAK